MKTALLLTLVLLSGCAEMTPRQKVIVATGAVVLATGFIAAHQSSESSQRKTTQPVNCANPSVCQ